MNNIDWLLKSFFIISFLILSFLSGAILTYFKYFPYQLINKSELAYIANKQKNKAFEDAKKSTLVKKNTRPMSVLKKNYDGYVLYTPHRTMALLIDKQGNELHRWQMSFNEAWKDGAPHVNKPLPDTFVLWYGLHVYPNGDLLATYHGRIDTPYGYGLVKLDKNSNLLWKIDDNFHHKIEVQPDGTIYALSQKIKVPQISGMEFHDTLIQEDFFVILDPSGNELKRISLLEALANSDFRDELATHVAKPVWKADIMHANSIMALPENYAKLFPEIKPNNILISMPTMNAIGILDIPTEKFVWFKIGPWQFQHDAQFTEHGTIIAFDNRGSKQKYSRILEYDFKTKKITSLFSKKTNVSFYAEFLGAQQKLPNGHWMIVSGMEGKILEVTNQGKLVWEFRNPYYDASYYNGKKRLPIVWARILPASAIQFLPTQ
ncbi:MAG: arylsulfotransferase family protein [Alphaproteobacteria bacterium]